MNRNLLVVWSRGMNGAYYCFDYPEIHLSTDFLIAISWHISYLHSLFRHYLDSIGIPRVIWFSPELQPTPTVQRLQETLSFTVLPTSHFEIRFPRPLSLLPIIALIKRLERGKQAHNTTDKRWSESMLFQIQRFTFQNPLENLPIVISDRK